MAATSSPKDFFEFVRSIGESKSKQEEDRIIADEVINLKKIIPQQPSVGKKKLKELLVRAIYVEMLGQDASFAYIKAVELCASTSIIQKRVGYLMAYLCLSPTHEFRFMLINQLQRDMKSSNQLETCAALAALCKLATEDMVPAVIGDVLKLLNHEMELVRKRAVIAMHRLYQLDKSFMIGHASEIRRALCDKDPSVMGGTLPLLLAMVRDDIAGFKDLVPSLVSILKQIIEHRLPKDYDYHRIPAPWVQMHLLRILAVLGKGDQSSSEEMYEVLGDVMKRADTGINVGYAIVYETVKTITSIYPNPILLDAAATAISRFIRSDSHNLKYIGVKGLAEIVKEYPKYAADHQMAVIDCLEDPDETLKRKTLDLLFRMTNSVNVEFIVEKLLSFLATASDDYFRTDLVGQISQCAERYAPSNAWYVQTIVRVFELAGDKVKMGVAQTLTQLIAEGASDNDAEEGNPDDLLRMDAVEDFLELIDNPKLSEILAQTMAWVLGEYGYLSESHTKEQIMDKLCVLAQNTNNSTTKAQVVTALMKLVAQSGTCPSKVLKFINKYSESFSLDLQQRCLEFKALLHHPDTMADVLPVDASCEDIDVDENLSFLDKLVNQALLNGAAPYSPPNIDDDDNESLHSKMAGLKITPYERPAPPPAPAVGILSAPQVPIQGPTPLGPAITNPSPILHGPAMQGNQLLNNRSAAAVWGKKPEIVVPPEPQPIPQAAQPNPTKSASSQSSLTQPGSSVPAVPIGVSSPPVPDGPKKLTEKELLAQALFSGVGGSSGNNAATRAAARANRRASNSSVSASNRNSIGNLTQTSPPTAPLPSADIPSSPLPTSETPQRNSQADLLDLDNDVPSSSTSALHASPFPTSLVHDFSAPDPIPHTTSSPAPTMSSNTQTTSPAASQSSTISDAFASLEHVSNPVTSLNTLGVGLNVFATTSKPLPINTEEFGKRWGQLNMELKQNVNSRIRGLEQLRSAMPSSYAHVESIQQTQEAIFAATSSSGQLILIHIKINALKASCDVTVKSNTRDVCGRELGAIANALSSFT